MIPNIQQIKISNNLSLIRDFISEVIVGPKIILHKWALITNQTPAAKVGYIGQHLASLITGVVGTGSGARGDDLADGSEVKSCNKIDQADKCKNCGNRVLRFETKCSTCGSENIERKDDSKWLFSVRDEHELSQYLHMDRIVLVLMDYPGFDNNNFEDVRISTYEIYPKEERMSVFGQLITNHYYNIYLPKLEANQKTNPMNLHPFSFQFYKCNPLLTFSCVIKNIDTNPSIEINEEEYIEPQINRDCSLQTIPMPSSLIKESKGEWSALINGANYETDIRPFLKTDYSKDEFLSLSETDKRKALPYLNEYQRDLIPLRDIISVRQTNHYQR